ncbi:MAG: hypothetical protein WBD22_10635 [Pyrinomonadaceae bacterium]
MPRLLYFLIVFCFAFSTHASASPSTPLISLLQFLKMRLAEIKTIDANGVEGNALRLEDICPVDTDPVSRRIFFEYGAAYAAIESVTFPQNCMYPDDKSVRAYQESILPKTATIEGVTIELQEVAMDALLATANEARQVNLRITPLDGTIAGKRTFADTERIWKSRFQRALDHWVAKRKISNKEARLVRRMSYHFQVKRVLHWESKGWYFSTDFSRSIFSATAPPGTSQHLSLLAFDVAEHENPDVVKLMNKNGWYRTILNDLPHFTYLGLAENELPKRGLRVMVKNGIQFWIPNDK